jgi:hypothetical protein
MKLEYTEGCVVSGLDIDEDRFHMMETEEQKAYFIKLLDWYKHKAFKDSDFQDFIIWVVEKYGDFKCEGYCEECGDSIYVTTLEI